MGFSHFSIWQISLIVFVKVFCSFINVSGINLLTMLFIVSQQDTKLFRRRRRRSEGRGGGGPEKNVTFTKINLWIATCIELLHISLLNCICID